MPELTDPLVLLGAVALLGILLVGIRMLRQTPEAEEQTIRRSQTVRVVSVVLLLAVIVGFAVANVHTVSVSWVFTETTAPMVLVIVLSGFVGFLIGALVASRRRAE